MDLRLQPACLAAVVVFGPLALVGGAHESAALSANAPCSYEDAKDGTQSYDILCREPLANHVKVKHILVGWKDLGIAGHPWIRG